MAGVIVGSQLDTDGFLCGVIATAGLLVLGGAISAVGIRNAKAAEQIGPIGGLSPLPQHPPR